MRAPQSGSGRAPRPALPDEVSDGRALYFPIMLPDSSATLVEIRPAVPEDAGPLAAFAAAIFRDTYATTAEQGDLEAQIARAFTPEAQRREISDPGWRTLLACVDGELAGYAQLCRGRAPACIQDRVGSGAALEVRRFYVGSRWHGRGVAQRLMPACLAARGSPHEPVWLGVYTRNPRAIAFYTKCGFRIVGEMTFLMGQDPQRDHVMVWEDAAGPSRTVRRPSS